MPKPKTIKLTLTEEEVELIKYALVTDIIEAKRTIEQCKRHPEDDRSAKYEAEAEAKIPALEALYSKLYRRVSDAKYGGETT